MNKFTIDKLKANPHYKPSLKQLEEDEEGEWKNPNVKTFGILPKQDTMTVPKTQPEPIVIKHVIEN